jgi:HlyD family secretion protein
MTPIVKTQNKFIGRTMLLRLAALAVLVVMVGVGWPRVWSAAQAYFDSPRGAAGTTGIETARVITVTAESYVTSVGAVMPVQSGTVMWKTTGTVAAVYARVGDRVQAGQPLMALDPLSAPQAVLAAQADQVSAQRALDDLLRPTALTVAQAQKNVAKAKETLDDLRQPPAVNVALARQTVAKAQDTLDKARKNLANTQSPDLKYYQDQVRNAQDALTNAQQNTTLTDIGQLPVALRNAQKQLETATDVYNNAKDGFAQCPNCEKVWAYDRMTNWADAQNLYTDAVNLVEQIQLQIDQSQRGSVQGVSTAQDNFDKAQRNLKWVQSGPDAIALAVNQAAVDVAESALADAQDKLNKLLHPTPEDVAVAEASLADAQDKLSHLQNGADPRDLAAAQARLAAAQATVNGLTLTAPFAGEVLAVNDLAGDAAVVGQAGVMLANRAELRVEAQIDEADVRQIAVGEPVSVTFEALPGLTVAGQVTWISENGAAMQGLVKYTVRVALAQSDPRVRLGMTANLAILADRQVGALAVPPGVLQRDQQGEFVSRVNNGGVERVSVTSGQTQDGFVVVVGALRPGDEVQVAEGRLP